MMEKERAEAIDALGRIHNYCEEIDHHIPEEERTGYKMISDVLKIFEFLYLNVSDLTAREIFEEIDRMCIDTFGNFNHRVFAELKKKYTESEKDDG